MPDIYNNSTSQFATHFLAGPKLIQVGRELYGLSSENWAYPTLTSVGGPRDDYYAEIWVDGMDWQNTYWILEHAYHAPIVAIPLVVFSSKEEEKNLNPFDLHELFRAAVNYRRNLLNPLGITGDLGSGFTDTVWPYLYLRSEEVTVNEANQRLG